MGAARYFGLDIRLAAGLFCLVTASAQAARFANQFVEFELPPKWQCGLEGAEWVCQSTEADKKRDAIIILAAKLKGDQDSLDQYMAYLKEAKSYTSVKGKAVKSEPKYAKSVKVNDHPWVDSLHLESELPGFYTRYLATVKNDIAVLVTYSINKSKYQQYLNDFDNLVKTLKVTRKPGGLNAASNTPLFNTQIPSDFSAGTVFPETINPSQPVAAAKPKQDDTLIWILGAVAVFGIYVFIRRRKK